MIISHSHRFVFVKTNKTAGSSLQSLLSQYLEAGDMMTAWSEIRKKPGEGKMIDELRSRGITILNEPSTKPEIKLGPHSSLLKAYKKFPEIKTYFSFGILRDPFKRCLSSFRWQWGDRIKKILENNFDEEETHSRLEALFIKHIKSGTGRLNNRGRDLLQSTTKDGSAWSVDRIYKLENLKTMQLDLAKSIGLNIDINRLPRLKSKTIQIPKTINLFSPEVILLIKQQHNWEIKNLRYKMPSASNII